MRFKVLLLLFFIFVQWLSVQSQSTKIDVWDFGAVQLDTAIYVNKLTVDSINKWYIGTQAGTSGVVLPSFTSGILTWNGGTNDRLRSTNKLLTRFDENIANSTDYTGRIYVNSGGAVARYLSFVLEADDEVTLAVKTDAGGELNFQYVADPVIQADIIPLTSDFAIVKFNAKRAGTYRIFDSKGKPSYFRIFRKPAKFITVTGKIGKNQAQGLPLNYKLNFTNKAGKSWSANISDSTYSVNLPENTEFDISLSGANGFVISSQKTVAVLETNITFDIEIQKVQLYAVSGSISGLNNNINRLDITFSPQSEGLYSPITIIDTLLSTYSVQLEPHINYTIITSNVNDFDLQMPTISIGNTNTNRNLTFTPKLTYKVTVNIMGLSEVQKAKLNLTFTNNNESGYKYTFTDLDNINLRNGIYSIIPSGIDSFPVEMTLTSDLKVLSSAISKSIQFTEVHYWPFDDRIISTGDATYKGLLFSGAVSNEIAKSHLVLRPNATVKVPVKKGDRVTIKYYYTADFTIEGVKKVTTNSLSTSKIEAAYYDYTNTANGYVTLMAGPDASTTYITDIHTFSLQPLNAILKVGKNKDFQTINAALTFVREMNRPNMERVTILVDPGNYEEMLDIDIPNVTIKNAASNPSIALTNKGVGIDPNAVRITSYYGHGYNYFSMAPNQRWNAATLAVNRENGSTPYANKGAGTTNNSYWNTTVLVTAAGFEAEDIIFENSFNQYISRKESQDSLIVSDGNKGLRPRDEGNTIVQNRSFVERACAIALANNTDKTVLYKCRVVGRQDALFGGANARFVMYKGSAMGAVDYIFGGMNAVFYKTELTMNTSDVSSDQTYITAAQQSSGRGYLMYECTVNSAIPGLESASINKSKPGYFGRPWQATTSEVVFYRTSIDASSFPGSEGKSLIIPLGWQNSLGGESSRMYEFATIETSNENNTNARAAWSTQLSIPKLSDGTDITTFNFTRGNDAWNPIPSLIQRDISTAINQEQAISQVNAYAQGEIIVVENVTSTSTISLFDVKGVLHSSFDIHSNTTFVAPNTGIWVVHIKAMDGVKSVKVFVR